ncbi:MAG: hypothetical protein WC758_07435 [Candidatus Woesearchaeota archaeon]|jgi:cell division septal protein FtsQ
MRYKKQKFNIFKALSILLIIIFVILIPTIIQKLIKIEKIECESQYGQCPEALISNLQFTIPNQFLISKSQIKKILEQNIIINSYLIQYQIPNKLKIDINLKKPRYAIFNGSKYFLIDKDGLIIEESSETNLPTLNKENVNLVVGEKIEEKDKFALSIINGLTYLYSINSGNIINDELKVTNSEGIIIRFPLEGDKDVLLGSLRLIFSRLNDETKGIRIEDTKEIDLRFKNPVLR